MKVAVYLVDWIYCSMCLQYNLINSIFCFQSAARLEEATQKQCVPVQVDVRNVNLLGVRVYSNFIRSFTFEV